MSQRLLKLIKKILIFLAFLAAASSHPLSEKKNENNPFVLHFFNY